MPNPVADAAERFRNQALARERAAATRMVRAYARVYRALDGQVEALELATRGRDLTPNQIRRLSVMATLRAQIVEQVNRFGVYAEQEVLDAMTREIGAGLTDSQALVLAHFDIDYLRQQGINGGLVQAEIRNAWNRLPVEAIENIVGMTGEDSPLHDALVNRLGPELADHAVNELVNGIALGRNPRVTARRIMGAGLTWAMTTARTAQLNAYREASHQSYRANRDVVSGWIWHAEMGPRTCISCLAKHGSRHSVDERLEDHHNGRCTQIPIVPLARKMGLPEPQIPDSEAWFNAQSEAVQKRIMGKGLLEGYKSGQWGFRELTTTYEDHVYGTMWRAPTLQAMKDAHP